LQLRGSNTIAAGNELLPGILRRVGAQTVDIEGVQGPSELGLMQYRACGFFSHQRDQTAYLTAIALYDGAEFGALGDGHADTLDNDIIDFVTTIVVNQPPVNPERRRFARASDVGRDDAPVAVAAAAANFESFAAKICEPSSVNDRNIVFEKLYKLLPLDVACASPICAENKSGDTRAVEILLEQLSEASLPYGGIGFVVHQLDCLIPQPVHNGDGVRWIYC